jgi:predicted O-methyltransferase YrrM
MLKIMQKVKKYAKYDLSHLRQETSEIYGPIQDDEALFLFALIKVMCLRHIVEIGGLFGYSAANFIKAIPSDGSVVTVDPAFQPSDTPGVGCKINDQRHSLIAKLAHEVSEEDLKIPHVDLVFFDCHNFESQLAFFKKFDGKLITRDTILALHDTGTHPIRHPRKVTAGNSIWTSRMTFLAGKEFGNYGSLPPCHKVERSLSNAFMDMGYSPFHLHVNNKKMPTDSCKLRHGLTILSKTYRLRND